MRAHAAAAAKVAWVALSLVLVAASALPLLSTDTWWVRALDFPRPMLTALLVAAAAGAWVALDRRGVPLRLLLAALLAALAGQLYHLRPYTVLHATQMPTVASCAPGDRLTILTANLRASNQGAAPFIAEVRRAQPDIVFVVEVDPRWAAALRPLEQDYPNRVVHPRDDHWGLALYARTELAEPEVRHLVSGYVPSLRTGLRLASGALVEFHGLHPKPPTPEHGTAQRDAELLLTALAARADGRATAVAGDLNAVAWSATTGLMQRIGRLPDPRVGRGFFLTFPTWLAPPLRFPIDHVFASSEFRLLALERLPDVGSDHLPLLARLCHAPAAGDATAPVPPADEADWRRARTVIAKGRADAARAAGQS